MDRIGVGVLGATGLVGSRIVRLLRGHPWFAVRAVSGSSRTVGKRYGDVLRDDTGIGEDALDLTVVASDPRNFDTPIILSALQAEEAESLELEFARAGHAVVSNAKSYRMAADVPLLLPEINWQHTSLIKTQQEKRGWSGLIACTPNCSTSHLVLVLAPISNEFALNAVLVTTMQAISGAGYDGVSALSITDNVIPHIGGEEEKIEAETLKILGREPAHERGSLRISATTTRVPVIDGHFESVSVEMEYPITAEEIIAAWQDWRPLERLELPTAPPQPVIYRSEPDRPQPRLDRDAGGGMSTSVGRLRKCSVLDWKFVLLGHNLVRGAAGNVILIAELLKAQGYVSG